MELTTLLSKPRLRFCLRVTISAVVAFALSQLLTVPLHGLWAVLTAVVVTQMSIGESLKATADYVVGTICGALYASAVATLVPHPDAVAVAGVLALAIAPLAYAAALNPSFRVAPFTAVLVLLISNQLGEDPIASALSRLLEVAMGGAVAIAVSVLVFPSSARTQGLDAAARVLERLADALPRLLAAVGGEIAPLVRRRIQDEIGQALDAFEAKTGEARRERVINAATEPDLAVLARSLLRLRHDFVIVGRAGLPPMPKTIAERLTPSLTRIGAAASDFLAASGAALRLRRRAPPVDPLETALAAYATEFATIREAGLTASLPIDDVERFFVLGFALQQLERDFSELAHSVDAWARQEPDGRTPRA